MKVSLNWLKDYVQIPLKPADLAERLSMLGLEVESFEDLARKFDKFIVGEVVEKRKHPNADKLTLCRVDVGREKLDIVCGAPNVAEGQKVAVALVGATIPRNQHDPEGGPFVLERAKIRGLESNGMICSEYEMGLGDDTEGIMLLEPSARVGMPLAKHLHAADIIYDVEVTANRGDWLSHIGVAREIQVITGKRAVLPKVKIAQSRVSARKHATIRIADARKCRRYSSRILRNVRVGPSPRWLQDRLSSVGIRPINNIVDVTNYVLIETGQPLHAFDYDTLAGHAIIVKCAQDGDRFVTLDGKERMLNSDILMICDGERPVAIAGVMGGANTEISEQTTAVLLESANFEQGSIRRASKFLGLATDASQRFERGVDIEMTVFAANRAAQLIQELTGAEVLQGVIDVYPVRAKPRRISLRVSRTNAVLGTACTQQQVIGFMKRLNIRPSSVRKDTVVFDVPSYRYDLAEEIDLIEEVARVYGYDNIETKTSASVDFSKPIFFTSPVDEVRSYLIGAGFNEILTDSLQDHESGYLTQERAVEVLNPVSSEASVLRTSLIPGALRVVQNNRSRGQNDLRLFEIGSVFDVRDERLRESVEGYGEEERLLLVISGRVHAMHYALVERQVDFLDLKGEVEALLSKFCLDKYRFISYDSGSALIDSGLAVEINGSYAGFLGKISKSIAERFDIEDDVLVSEFKTAVILKESITEKKLRALPRFPSVRRDLAFIVEATVPQERIEAVIRGTGGGLVTQVRLFDLYVGGQVGAGKKSLAYALELQPLDRTLTDREADEFVGHIVRQVELACGAKLRSL